ncbi:MAG: FAD-dependent oxidoreductase [Syntrophorhabdales bacterium]|jgi:NADPH-dependent glutamate synthase beta subunit-like oxidoreductase
MDYRHITIKDIEPIIPFSRGSTEIFFTGQWSGKKPVWVEKTSACREGCPIGNDIPRAFSLASKGLIDEALAVFRQDNPFPGICGRICYHPCQTACNRAELDEAVNVRGFERFLADHGRVSGTEKNSVRRRKERVAVIGSGPAGLSASYHLARLGYHVTVFEALPRPGGMLMYGIPEYRLPKAVLTREIASIKKWGVKIKTGIRVVAEGQPGLSLSDVRRDHQAVFIAVGAPRGMRLGVEGEDLPGVVEGMAFLRDIAPAQKGKARSVVVVGGGNTAIDCARTAGRMGAREVRIVCPEMAAVAEEVMAATREGIKIDRPAVPRRFIAENGRVFAVECMRAELGPLTARGWHEPLPVAGSEFVVPADMVIVAVGQVPETAFLARSGVTVDKGGMVEISSFGTTGAKDVFAGGDGAGAKMFAADAIASGKMAALAIFCFFEGKDVGAEFALHRIGNRSSFSFQHVIDPEGYGADLKQIVTYDKLNTVCVPYAPMNDNPERLSSADRAGTFREVVAGLGPQPMHAEIERCMKCGTCTQCDLCFLLCPDISVVKEKDGYRLRPDYCKGCGVCATTCPRNVVDIGGEK